MFRIFQQRRLRRHLGYSSANSRAKRISQLATLLLIGTIGLAFFVFFLFAWYSKDLPRPDKVRRVEGLSTVIFDRNGEVLYDIYADQNRVPIPFAEMPLALRQATISIEDKDFYKHQGVSLRGLGRALINIFVFHNLQGGSTLTQQLVKNALLSSERTLPRKIKEFILAIQIERKYSKDEILQMYLNEAPYGGIAWGVEVASQTYFGKHTKDLSLVESVILAGLPQSPTQYSPFGSNPKAYVWRSEQVLRRMREDGYLTSKEEETAKKQLSTVEFAQESGNFKAAHFVMYVKDQLVAQFGEKLVEEGGLKVTTTLDWKIQKEAEKIVREEVLKARYLKVSNAAVVILDSKTGEILSMIGSKDYNATESGGYKFNVATQGLRQPGSAIKPIVYATAFKKGYTPSTLVMDVETGFPGGEGKEDYKPKNYDGKFRGPVQLRYALASSINLPAVKILAMVGVKNALSTAFDMGLTTLEPTDENLKRLGLSMVLGGGEVKLLDLTSAFSVFSNNGVRHEPVSILKVTDSRGKVIFENKAVLGKKVLSEQISFLISSILSDNEARKEVFGPNSWLLIPGKTVAVKTGTTDDKRDNWTIGYTASLTVGVWVGNNDNSPMDPSLASGVTGAAPIWNRIMKFVFQDKADEPFGQPPNIVSSNIDSFAGGLAKEGIATRNEFFISGTEPTQTSPVYQRLKISKNNGKLANKLEIAKGEYEEKDFVVITEKDPVSTDGKNRWQEGIDKWIAFQSDNKFRPPTETSSEKENEVVVKIKNPGDHGQIDDNDVLVEVEAVSNAEIIKMEILVDGTLKKSVTANKFSERINLDKGVHTIKAKAQDSKGNQGESQITIGVLVPWDFATPAPTPTP